MTTVINTRERWIDGLKAFLMLSVVFEHIIQFAWPNWKDNSWYCFITSFNMACFFMLAGYTFCFSSRKLTVSSALLKHIVGRFQRLFVPFLAWSLIFTFLFFNLKDSQNILLSFKNYASELAYHPDKGLWFLLTLFTIEISSSVLVYLKSKITPTLGRFSLIINIITSVTLFGFLYIGQKLEMIGFFNAGYYSMFYIIGFWMKKRDITNEKWFVHLATIALFVFIIMLPNFTFGNSSISTPYRIGLALSGCLAFISIFKFISKGYSNKFLFDFIGKNTLAIYCIHGFFIKSINLSYIPWPTLQLLVVLALTIFISTLCVLISNGLKSFPYIDLIFNGNPKAIAKN